MGQSPLALILKYKDRIMEHLAQVGKIELEGHFDFYKKRNWYPFVSVDTSLAFTLHDLVADAAFKIKENIRTNYKACK